MVAREHAAATHRPKPLPVAHICIGLAILGAAAVLLFVRLGHYALWDDEATTALSAIGVWRTGDTVALVDHNIVAYRGGAELRNFHFRYIPPLPSYLAAPFVGLMGNSSLAARLPFAIAGLICVTLMVWWLWKDRASLLTWTLLGLAILGNVSLFLYFRQARYYGVAILASAVMAYLYLQWDGRRRPLLFFALISLCLWTSNYLNYVAFYSCLAVDYLLWGRKRQRLQQGDWITLFLPQPVGQTVEADVRYLAPLIPLGIFLGMAVVRTICRGKWWIVLSLAVVAFGTNALQLYPFYTGEFRSTISLYARELLDPPNDPYKEAAKWINTHVEPQQTIWVLPDYMTYPLMYHAPKAIYAWQLSNPPEPQFQGLDPIHFQGVVPPDYVIAFGPVVRDVREFLRSLEQTGIEYRQIETLDILWLDRYRPELVWRTFAPITNFDRDLEAIYIFQRVRPPLVPTEKTRQGKGSHSVTESPRD